ncbi:stage II sporulation protein M [Paenibacillus flagellatus]|uniref:Stage II sporulation protein M n=1 Tax=Paenibacillus flagellatus TaxID=2211139 RepID=A0A2V5JU69_9BACL|nr:stage II sporulation protein M [Paenibacillus flagellatus]PYI50175.1 stage II sporulation protein M [Paenibacillus flagellatus]
MSIHALFRHFKEMHNYFIAATLVFVCGIVLGYGYSDRFDNILQSQVEGLRDLAKAISEKDHSMLWLFGFIFLNNAIKSVLIVYAGVFFGILPIGFLLINGMVIGYLAELQTEAGQLAFLLKGLIPHGVIEIPAIIIACAYGIKFGSIMGKGTLRLVNARGRQSFAADLERFMKLTVPLIGLLVVSLLAAAIIESFVTPWVIRL